MRALRTVMHVHSDWSYDGSWPLADIARLFERFGADLVLMSEHDNGFSDQRFQDYRAACAAASTAKTLLVPGIEYSSTDNSVHILSWGLDHFHGERRPTLDILKSISDHGGAAILAHPKRRNAFAQVSDDWLSHLSAIEIWNRKADGYAPSKIALDLKRRFGLPGTAGMDFHALKHVYPLYNKLDASDPRQAAATISTSIKAGRLTPVAFGRAILDETGAISTPVRSLAALEHARRRVARLSRSAGPSQRPV